MNTTHGNQGFFFVSGFGSGREVFLGRPIEERRDEAITLEGKSIGMSHRGHLVVRPFATSCTVPTHGPTCQVQRITNPEALAEATSLLTMPVTIIRRSNHPWIHRWIEMALADATAHARSGSSEASGGSGEAFDNQFGSFHEDFRTGAEQFRRALFQTPRVSTTRELDTLTELEANLTIESGKITNQVAIKLNALMTRNGELERHFEALRGPAARTAGGAPFLMQRLQIAKHWARRKGKTALVRDINALTKEGVQRLNEIVLEHCSALDTLISETSAEYGIAFEAWNDACPLADPAAPSADMTESVEHATMDSYAGAAS